jgi:hypothetical protein
MRERSRAGAAAPMLLAAIGAAGLAALTLALGGGLLLAIFTYSLGGTVLLVAAATAASYGPVAVRARAPSRLPDLEGLRHG